MELFLIAGAVAAGVALVGVWLRNRNDRRRLAAADLGTVRRSVDEDVTALGEELQLLDAETVDQPLDPRTRRDYQHALDAYESAKESAASLERPDDARPVAERLDDGRFAIICVQARLAGEPLPERRAPCFFDPRHGNSVADARWAPPGGGFRDVPACALDAERVRTGAEPAVRKVLVGSRHVPYWRAGRAFVPVASGYYGLQAGSLFTGTAIGFALVGHGGLLGDHGGHYGGGDGYGGGGGDYGGADYGGSDVGGGGGF